MKTNTPTYTAKVDQTKTRKDGLAPVYIFINWRGRAKESTGIYIQPNQLKNNVIKGNAKANSQLQQKLEEIENTINTLKNSGLEFTAKDCLNKTTAKPTPLKVVSLMEHDRQWASTTAAHYMASLNTLQRIVNEDFWSITTDRWQGIAKQLSNIGQKNSSIKGILTDCKSIYNYALSHGLTNNNPLANWKFWQDGYKDAQNPKAVDNQILDEMIIIATSNNYTDKKLQDAVKIWLSGYYFSGMALCDLMKTDWAEVFRGMKLIDNECIINFQYHRQKTRQKASVCVEYNGLIPNLLSFLMAKPWGKRTTAQYAQLINKQLDKVWAGVTYYSCRHTFCTSLVNSNQVALNDIATLMGRSVNTIGTYIRQIQAPEHLKKATANLHRVNFQPSRATESTKSDHTATDQQKAPQMGEDMLNMIATYFTTLDPQPLYKYTVDHPHKYEQIRNILKAEHRPTLNTLMRNNNTTPIEEDLPF